MILIKHLKDSQNYKLISYCFKDDFCHTSSRWSVARQSDFIDELWLEMFDEISYVSVFVFDALDAASIASWFHSFSNFARFDSA